MRIEVTKKDIENGVPCNSEQCAISQALMRHFKTNVVCTHVDGDHVEITVDGYSYYLLSCSKSIINFINIFDDSLEYSVLKVDTGLKPFSFEIKKFS